MGFFEVPPRFPQRVQTFTETPVYEIEMIDLTDMTDMPRLVPYSQNRNVKPPPYEEVQPPTYEEATTRF